MSLKNNLPETAGNAPEPWMEFLVKGMCSLCGQAGIIDTRGIRTPANFECGGLHYCICPNGRALKAGNAPKEKWLNQAAPSQEAVPTKYSNLREELIDLRGDILSATGTRDMTVVERNAVGQIEFLLAKYAEPAPSPATKDTPPMETLTHTRSCPALTPGETCTCGLEFRAALQTEQTMHAAWRKRAEEAEAREQPLSDEELRVQFENGPAKMLQLRLQRDESGCYVSEPAPSPATMSHKLTLHEVSERLREVYAKYGISEDDIFTLESNWEHFRNLDVGAPSPATKDTPWPDVFDGAGNPLPKPTSEELAKLREDVLERVHAACKPNAPGVKSISQGPAREETPTNQRSSAGIEAVGQLLKTRFAGMGYYPATVNFEDCDKLMRAAFNAGAQSRTPTNLESRTVAPQPEKDKS